LQIELHRRRKERGGGMQVFFRARQAWPER
jgi:hypothetical protein